LTKVGYPEEKLTSEYFGGTELYHSWGM